MCKLSVGMAQLNYTIGDFAGNGKKISDAIRALSGRCDLIVFSELCISGYYPLDLLENQAFLAAENAVVDSLVEESKSVRATIVIGCTRRNLAPGKPLLNSIIAIRDGQIVGEYNKKLLPTYNIFDERRHFEPGKLPPMVLDIDGCRAGFVICEDGWNDEGQDYAENPVKEAAEQGIDVLISVNASPSNVGKADVRRKLFGGMAEKYGFPVVYVNQVGGNDQIVFDGGSFVAQSRACIIEMPFFEEGAAVVEFRKTAVGMAVEPRTPEMFKAPQDIDPSMFYYQQIGLGLNDYMDKCNFKTVVVGLSGGIDSALTVALAAHFRGPENVIAITMPSKFSSTGSVVDSQKLCDKLGVRLLTHPIKDIFNSFEGGFTQYIDGNGTHGVTTENLQARIRGMILMEYSNEYGSLLLSTGNKSEMSVGYATLYGDMNGGLNLIGDLYKTEVFALSRWINEVNEAEIIPLEIIEKAPSAELAPGQKDSDSLPDYPVLDEILKWYIEGESQVSDENAQYIAKVKKLVDRAEFKRRQAPPIIRVRPRAFGNGRQMPIAAKY